ncbi:MAG: MORN repeat-containing protein [Desulfovibrio sp.]
MRLTKTLGMVVLLGCFLAAPAEAQCIEGNCINGSGTKVTRGHKYTGEFKDNHREGYGTYEFPNGDQYTGEFVQGSMEGQGVYKYANGDRYKGGFRGNLPDGVGEFTYADGKIVKGVFEKGILVKPNDLVESEDLPEGDHSGLSSPDSSGDYPDSVGVRPWDTDADHAGSEPAPETGTQDASPYGGSSGAADEYGAEPAPMPPY